MPGKRYKRKFLTQKGYSPPLNVVRALLYVEGNMEAGYAVSDRWGMTLLGSETLSKAHAQGLMKTITGSLAKKTRLLRGRLQIH